MHQQREGAFSQSIRRRRTQNQRDGLLRKHTAMLGDGHEFPEHDLATEQIKSLDLSGPLPYGCNTHVTVVALRVVVLS